MRLILKALIFVLYKINLQTMLYIIAFLTFGFGDGITSAYMMEVKGPYIEANPIIRNLFLTLGFEGMVIVKLWVTVMMMFATYIVQRRSRDNMYWTINGFLIAHIASGIIAINANLSAISGVVQTGTSDMLFAYIALVLMLTEIGSFVDKHAGYEI